MSAIRYPFEQTPEHGTALEVAPGVHWLRMPLPFALDHINLWLLRDNDGWTVVDTGIARPDVQAHWERIFAEVLEGRPVRRLIVTHYHPDHVGLASWLTERWGVALWMSQAEFLTAHLVRSDLGAGDRTALARFFGRHGLDEERVAAFTARGNTYSRGVPALPVSYRRIAAGDTIAIDGRSWQVLVSEGHAPEHVSLHCPELGVLIAGDQVLPRISPHIGVYPGEPEAGPLTQYLDSFAKFAHLPADVLVLPAHGDPFIGLHARIDMLRRHHQVRLDALIEALHRPHTVTETLPLLFRRDISDHMTLATGEALAHLHHLMRQGRITRRRNAAGIWEFQRDDAPAQVAAQ